MFLTISTKKDLSELEDEAIVNQIICQQESQFKEELYDRYINKIYQRCLMLLKDPHAAEDLAHDIMIKIFNKLDTFKGTSNFCSWMNAIAYNTCMSFLRDKKKIVEPTKELKYDAEGAANEMENRVIRELRLMQLEICFEMLAEEDKRILLMHYRDNIPATKIAEQLNIGYRSVKPRLQQSIKKLSKLMLPIKEKIMDFNSPEERIFNFQRSLNYFNRPDSLMLCHS